MDKFEIEFAEKIQLVLGQSDPSHDLLHVKRVVHSARQLANTEKAKLEVVLPAAWLHDIINLPKNHPERSLASTMASSAAIEFLRSVDYPKEYFSEISHAIQSHSFSSGISPQTLEARIVQDADRLDALGAIGVARLFSISAQLHRPFYNSDDPFAESRKLNDQENAIDHIMIKLIKIKDTINTDSAKKEAKKRFRFIEIFLEQLKKEI